MHLWVVIQHEELQVEYWVKMTDPCRVDCRCLTVICTVYSHKLALLWHEGHDFFLCWLCLVNVSQHHGLLSHHPPWFQNFNRKLRMQMFVERVCPNFWINFMNTLSTHAAIWSWWNQFGICGNLSLLLTITYVAGDDGLTLCGWHS